MSKNPSEDERYKCYHEYRYKSLVLLQKFIGKGLCAQNIKQMITVFSIQFWPEGDGWGQNQRNR